MKKSILFLFLLSTAMLTSMRAQEIRLQGNFMVLGYIEGPFIGAGAGFETGAGEHLSLNFDVNVGSHEHGSSLELRPAVNYYFGMQQTGFFIGAAFKYISLQQDDELQDRWEDKLYSVGFNLGIKAPVNERLTLLFVASPHKTVGGQKEGDVAGLSAQLGVGWRI